METPHPRAAALQLAERLDGRRLERVLGWSLIFVMIVAVSLPIYFLAEPNRQDVMAEDFTDDSLARGATLYANNQSPAYDPVVSLLCANCHGVTA